MQAATISNLCDVPGLAAAVADSVWNAWWREHGVSRAYIARLVD